jgi:hypothetical protein
MTEEESREVWELRTKWLNLYRIVLIDGVWKARRYTDATVVLTAGSANELDAEIENDYAKFALSS